MRWSEFYRQGILALFPIRMGVGELTLQLISAAPVHESHPFGRVEPFANVGGEVEVVLTVSIAELVTIGQNFFLRYQRSGPNAIKHSTTINYKC